MGSILFKVRAAQTPERRRNLPEAASSHDKRKTEFDGARYGHFYSNGGRVRDLGMGGGQPGDTFSMACARASRPTESGFLLWPL
jgi:hypothetical protein